MRKKYVKQTGLLFSEKPTGYILGVNSPIMAEDINEKGDWEDFLPEEEVQNKQFVFDTMSCATFSCLNVVETWINFFISKDMLTVAQLERLNKLGFFVNGKFNASDRFSAIMSGTTKNGNYLENVWESIRKYGLLPEKDLPFDPNFKTWEEYHDNTKITEAMKTKAKEVLDIFSFAYEFVSLKKEDMGLIENALKQSPIHAGIPYPATHAVEIFKDKYYFDTYSPFKKKYKKVHFSVRGILTIKKDIVLAKTYKWFNPKSDPKMVGVSDKLMEKIDLLRDKCGFAIVITSGVRTASYNSTLEDSVSNSAHLKGLAVDLLCTDSKKRYRMLQVAFELGFTRIGLGKNYLHLDIDDSKSQDVAWNY
jgi:hypothetical protein